MLKEKESLFGDLIKNSKCLRKEEFFFVMNAISYNLIRKLFENNFANGERHELTMEKKTQV